MRLGYRWIIAPLSVLLGVGLVAPADAASSPQLTLTGSQGYAGTQRPVTIELVDGEDKPIAAPVQIDRRTTDGWRHVTVVHTGEDGVATRRFTIFRNPERNRFRATYRDDGTTYRDETTLQLRRRNSRVVVGGPRRVVDERSVPIRVRWVTGTGEPVAGRVKLYRSLAGHRWKLVRTLRTGRDGRAQLRTRPRSDSRWRAIGIRQAWVSRDRSNIHRVNNLPPGEPVKLPRAAPRPRRHLPAQGHAAGAGPNVRITRIPSRVWRQMTGVSWHRGCPVGRAGLRLVRVNYWDYTGYRRRGELVASAGAAHAMGAALAEMYRRDLPIRAMYRVDRFGWSSRSRGGDDYASMAAGNTSAFNCRDVTGRPGVRSPHSYGRSLDVNTWENPYRSARGLVPNSWWQGHSHPRVAWRSRAHVVVRLMARHGLRWTYGLGDTQHFDYVGSRARAAVRPIPCDRYCD